MHSRPQLPEAIVIVNFPSIPSIAVKLSLKVSTFTSFPRQNFIKPSPYVAEILPGGELMVFYGGDLNSYRFDNSSDRKFISFDSIGSDENFGQHQQHLRLQSDLTPPVLMN